MANVYTAEEAAEFLKISLDRLALLTAQGKIQQHQHHQRLFYLGGVLDAAKSNPGLNNPPKK